MAFKKIPLTIDTMIRNPVPVEGINQEDNVELNIVVTENKTPKDLSRQTIKVYVRRIDGTLVEQTDQITPTNASKGEVTVKLKNSAFNKEGYALFQLDISDSIGRITSSYATFKIGKGLVSAEAIANTNEVEALKKIEEYIKKANQELETFKQTVAEINENEATRQENEVVRVREEASRNEAEAIRVQQEATRKEKENERVQAEIKRIADEEMRRENEVLRGSKELERKQAEELRKETELLRIEDENNRKVAESKRIEAESVRVEAEKLRVAAETGRVEAENLRNTAEEERVAAETKREEGFNKFEGKINANTEELKNARSATTGEKFNSLDERIDCEIDRLNKKIEVSFLQQEDKENHVIENTVEGMTTNMIIKGKTLYKKSDGSYTDILEENVTLESFGQQEDKISILSRSKNLYNEATNFYPRGLNENGTWYPTDGSQYGIKELEVEPNTEIIISGKGNLDRSIIVFLNKNKEIISKTIGFQFTTPSNCYYFNAYIGQNASLITDVQVEKAKVKTDYVKHQQDKKDILLSELGFDEGLRGLNNIVYHELNDIKNMAIKRIDKRVFNGNETWYNSTVPEGTDNETIRFQTKLPNAKDNNGDKFIANYPTGSGGTTNIDAENIQVSNGVLYIRVKKSKLETQDLNGFVKWLKSNPLTIYFELKEPVETPLDESIALKVFNEKTYVEFQNSISGTSSFKAPANTVATIARLNRENRALEEENKTLRQDFESTTLSLTDSDLELVKQNVDMDFRLMEVEFALDIPQAILSSNIKFKNKKGEVKSMARTPYEMMKIVILSGDYDREDYIHKVGKYYERGRMSKEEHDELMSLMTADEVIGG